MAPVIADNGCCSDLPSPIRRRAGHVSRALREALPLATSVVAWGIRLEYLNFECPRFAS